MSTTFLRPALLTFSLGLMIAPVTFGQTSPSPSGASPAEIWLSPTGSDTNAGTGQSPLLTFSAAQRKARSLRRINDRSAAAGIRIILKGGIYPLNAPIQLTPEDGGSPASPSTIEAAPNEHPLFSGGVAVKQWQKLNGKMEGLPDAAVGHVWVAPSPVFNGRALEFRQLWMGNSKSIRARYPNGDTCERLAAWDRKAQEAGVRNNALHAGLPGEQVEMILQQQWEIAILRIKSTRDAGELKMLQFQDPESKLEFEHPWPQPILPPTGGGAFFLANSIEFLDSPGEWFQDLKKENIYYWPRDGEDLSTTQAIVPALETLVVVEGTLDKPVSHLAFKNIAFAHSSWMQPSRTGHVPIQAGMPMIDSYKITPKGTPDHPGLDNQNWVTRLPAAVTVKGASNVRFERCRFEHTAASALDFVTGTHDDVIEGNVFRDIGGNALQMGSFQESPLENHVPYNPTDQREICQKERIANNLVTDAANEDWGGVGLCVGYARDITIEHNEVNNVSYTAISLGWGWTKLPNALRDNKVHANYTHHIATRMCDTAGVYTLSNQPGTIVSENRVEDVKMSPYVDRPEHWFYLYTDEGSSNITMKDNWIPDETKILKNANGPNNVFENNGPTVSDAIKNAAGLEPAFRDLLDTIK